MRLVRALSLTLLALAASSVTREAAAGPPAVADAEEAGRLFERGKALMNEGRNEEACRLLARSQELDPADGTQLALALCHEQEGKSVLAYNELARALGRALASSRDDRQRVARAAMTRLQPRVGRLTLRVSGQSDGVTVMRDAQAVAPEELGVESALESGSHTLELRRGAVVLWSDRVMVNAGSATVVVIPAPREASPEPAAKAPSPLAEVPHEGPHRDPQVVAWVIGGVGVAALAVGGFFGVRAFGQWSDVKARCTPSACTDASARDTADGAKSAATASNVLFVSGAVLVTTSLVLLLTHRSTP